MRRPSGPQVEAARELFAKEAGSAQSAEERAVAAGRVHDRIVSHLETLIGGVAVRALLARSVRLTVPDFPCLGTIRLVSDRAEPLGERLVVCLRGETPEAVTETAIALYATLIALLGTLIGERLTAQVLRKAWPDLGARAPSKEIK